MANQQKLLAIVAPLDDEMKIIRARLTSDERVSWRTALIIRGRLGEQPVLIVRAGLGKKAMARTMTFVAEMFALREVVHVGFCGGADPKLSTGDMVLGTTVIDDETGATFAPTPELLAHARDLCRGQLRWQEGVIATVAEFIPEPHEKAFIGTRHGAIAVDMESAALAAVCATRGIPYLVVRSVLDPLDMQLPDFERAVSSDGVVAWGSLLGMMAEGPKRWCELVRAGFGAAKAREAITTFVDAWVQR